MSGLLGCAGAQRFAVTVNGLAAETQPAGARYVLLPADPELSALDLQFLEFARIVERGLEARGYQRRPTPEEADLAILLHYGVGERETATISYPTPAFAYFRDPVYAHSSHGFGTRHRHGARCRHRGYAGSLGYSAFGSPYGPGAYVPTLRTITTVNRSLSIEARVLEPGRPAGAGRALWSTTVESRGGSDDLRRVFPVLVGAAVDYLAIDTGQRIETTISEDDVRIERLRSARVTPATLSVEPAR